MTTAPHFCIHTVQLSLGLQTGPLLSGRSSRCLRKWGKAVGESVSVNELLRILDLHLVARAFIKVEIDH